MVVKQEHYVGNNGIAPDDESDVGGNDYAWSPLGEAADWELEEERQPRKRRKRRQRYSLKEDFIDDDDDDDIENEGCPREKRKRTDGVPEHWKGDAEIRCDYCPAMVRKERDK